VSIDRQQQLERGLDKLGVLWNSEQIEKLHSFLSMLERWNKTFNLTAIRDPFDMLKLHLLDSATMHQPIQLANHIIDVGSGAGLPGIPLAILNPEKQFTLLDSNGKKTRFIFQARSELALTNVKEVNSRVETYQPEIPFDMVITRAFSSLPKMLQQCDHLVSNEGVFLAMKGKKPDLELSQIQKEYMVSDLYKVMVPETEGERHLIEIKKITNEQLFK
jgi:16S rRNA (guanine527-N7)-methyltransferase